MVDVIERERVIEVIRKTVVYKTIADLLEQAINSIPTPVAIEGLLYDVERLQLFADNISKLPDCNTCIKKNECKYVPRYGQYCRINCPLWIGQPYKIDEVTE